MAHRTEERYRPDREGVDAPGEVIQLLAAKLKRLCEIEGFDSEEELFAAAIGDSVCSAICCNPDNPDCDYTAEMEPDQDRGWCEECQAGTMMSALVLGCIV